MYFHTRRSALFTLAALLAASGPLALRSQETEKASKPKTVSLLTVGNSFSHNAVHYLGDLARASGEQLVLREIVVGGAPLELHWGKAEAHEKDPSDKAGIYASGRGLKEELLSDQWDFVTIQQA